MDTYGEDYNNNYYNHIVVKHNNNEIEISKSMTNSINITSNLVMNNIINNNNISIKIGSSHHH